MSQSSYSYFVSKCSYDLCGKGSLGTVLSLNDHDTTLTLLLHGV